MTYEEALRKLNSNNRQVLETIEEAIQMLSPADIGRKAYNDTMRDYYKFYESLNLDCLKRVAHTISCATGMHLEVR